MKWLDRKIDSFIRRIRDRRMSIAVGPPDDPTYHRYFVIPRNRFFNCYLHHFRHSDAENLHDHRMANITILLQGSYMEERFLWAPIAGDLIPGTSLFPVWRLRPLFRLPSTPHRVVLYEAFEGKPMPVWSLFIGGPHVRDWGFWDRDRVRGWARWTSHEEVVASINPTSPGYGQNRHRL